MRGPVRLQDMTGLNVPIPALADIIENSPLFYQVQINGVHRNKLITIDGNGAQNDNLFQLTGNVALLRLHAEIARIGDITTFSGVKFELYDGTITVDITDTIDVSGAALGSYLTKGDISSGNLILGDAATAVVLDPVTGPPAAINPFVPAILIQKNGVNTYLRIAFTGDANTDLDLNVHAHIVPLSEDWPDNLVAV